METILLVLILSLDSFLTSIAYGTNKIKIPFSSIIIINIVCTFFLSISLLLGSQIRKILPGNIAVIVSFALLFLMGLYYLFEGLIKSHIEKKSVKSKIKLKIFNIYIIVDIYLDETKADFNKSKKLDSIEAIALATTLSIDSLAIGFGSSLSNVNGIYILGLSFLFGIFSVWSGQLIGRKLIENSKLNLSWLAGVILIILAFLKIL
ncbi:sporulation membrane protein YtaF [Paratissierella segnis]|uniref:Sporulation membrane protein YtaF n=1 Tax=Paratissierella segnis TaxID=2763679 RepID=A0A926ESR3_9FIRM|nr:sporulation membrane protein YtaF [Paratissierella segnis]MBC8586971.1 sporulation membrane protein YtaF [Paratissierella segnis]